MGKKKSIKRLKFGLKVTNLQMCSKEITKKKTERKGWRKYSFIISHLPDASESWLPSRLTWGLSQTPMPTSGFKRIKSESLEYGVWMAVATR